MLCDVAAVYFGHSVGNLAQEDRADAGWFLLYRKIVDARGKSPAYRAIPSRMRGRFANVTDVGAGCGGRESFTRASADV